MLGGKIQAECKKCGGKAEASSFRLDYLERLMVCPNCFKGRGKVVKKVVKNEVKERPRPAGWDSVDEELAKRIALKKTEQKGKIERIPGSTMVKYTCPSCTFKFRYNPILKRPKTCPYCNKDNPKIKITGIF